MISFLNELIYSFELGCFLVLRWQQTERPMERTRNKNRSIQMVLWSVDTSFFYISQLIDTVETTFTVNGLKFRTLFSFLS